MDLTSSFGRTANVKHVAAMQETSPTRKHGQNHEFNVFFHPQSLRRRRIGRSPKDKMRCNFNDDIEERNTFVKPFYVNTSPTSKRYRPTPSENLSKKVNFGHQNNNYKPFIKKKAATQKSTTPRNKITSNLQIIQDIQKPKSNVVFSPNKSVRQKHTKTHFENIGKNENKKITQINAFNLHGENGRSHKDILVMNGRARTETFQQSVPSCSKDQSGKLYQNKEATDLTFMGKYMDGAQNCSDSREKACKNTFISHKQIFKEARELHRLKMVNNILWPNGKGCNISDSHALKEDFFATNHNVYSTEPKGMTKQQKPSQTSTEQYKKNMSKNDLV